MWLGRFSFESLFLKGTMTDVSTHSEACIRFVIYCVHTTLDGVSVSSLWCYRLNRLTFVPTECVQLLLNDYLLGVCQQILCNTQHSFQTVCVVFQKSGIQVSSDIFRWHGWLLWAVEQQTLRGSPFPSFHSPFCSQQPLQTHRPPSNNLHLPREAVEQNHSLYRFMYWLQIMNIKVTWTDSGHTLERAIYVSVSVYGAHLYAWYSEFVVETSSFVNATVTCILFKRCM